MRRHRRDQHWLGFEVDSARCQKFVRVLDVRDFEIKYRARMIEIRPFRNREHQSDATAIEVTASVVEPLGADTLVFFEISGLEMVARVSPEAARDTGERVRLQPDLRRMHLFDPATGKRI